MMSALKLLTEWCPLNLDSSSINESRDKNNGKLIRMVEFIQSLS